MNEYFTYINNRLCVAARWLFEPDLGDVISKSCYEKWNTRESVEVAKRGCSGNIAMIIYDSIKPETRQKIEAKLGCSPHDVIKGGILKNYLKPDEAALNFFTTYIYGDDGYEKSLPSDVQEEYYANAVVLNAVKNLLYNKKQLSALVNGKAKTQWEQISESVQELLEIKGSNLKPIYPHTLSSNARVLERQYKKYITESYESLIHKNFGNKSAQKVTKLVEDLILSIYAMDTKPYMTSKYEADNSVHGIYLQFLGGAIDLVNVETGEVFNRADFYDKKGNILEISSGTVQNYIKKLESLNTLEKIRNNELYWNAKWRPTHHRHAANYSFSKLTMDDIAIPFKRPDGTRVWAYQVYDTLSTCVVGRSYAKDKSADMLIESLKDMMRLCVRNGWGFAGEIECEQHLANTLTGSTDENGDFEADILTAGTLFPFVSFQRGGMPQGKRAEGFIKAKKYSQQSKRIGFQRRPFSLLEANRLNTDNNNMRYTLQEIIANEEIDINNYNNSLHPDQDRFKGKTRWQVLIENINPNLSRHPMHVLAYYLGECNKTAQINRSQWVRVKNKNWMLPTPEIIKRLKGLTVEAYYIPGVDEVFIYQDKRYICACSEIDKYNEAKIERTETDEAIELVHQKYVAKFDKMTKDKKLQLANLEIIRVDKVAKILESQPDGNTPIHGEFDEPDLETVKQEKKEFRKQEREREKQNTTAKTAFFEMINNTDFGE